MATLSQPIIVTDTYFAGKDDARSVEAGINAILNDFYEATLSELPKPEAALARHFIEEGLIVNGRRAGVTEGVEKVQFQIEETLLKKLLDSRLVRAENTHLGKSYEVSHDAMVAPIMESYEKRKARERQEKEVREKAEQRRKLRRAVIFAVVGFLFAAVAVVGLVIAIQQTKFAKGETARAEAEADRAEEAKHLSDSLRIETEKKLAEIERQKREIFQEQGNAKKALEEAQRKEQERLNEEQKRKIAEQKNIINQIIDIEILMKVGDTIEAKKLLDEAFKIFPEHPDLLKLKKGMNEKLNQ